MTELGIGLLSLCVIYAGMLYISIGSRVDIRDILLVSLLAPSIFWLKVYGSVLSFLGIQVYYMMVFDEENPEEGV